MPLYSVEVRVYATVYIRAESAQCALLEAQAMENTDLADYEIYGGSYEDCPEVSFSPAMTIKGPDPETTANFVEEDA